MRLSASISVGPLEAHFAAVPDKKRWDVTVRIEKPPEYRWYDPVQMATWLRELATKVEETTASILALPAVGG